MGQVPGRTAPANYGELFEQYFDFVKYTVRSRGIRIDEVEDVATEILLRFMDDDYLSRWDEPCECDQRDLRQVKTTQRLTWGRAKTATYEHRRGDDSRFLTPDGWGVVVGFEEHGNGERSVRVLVRDAKLHRRREKLFDLAEVGEPIEKLLCKNCGGRMFETSSGLRISRFSGLLKRFVHTYVLQHRDKQETLATKEPYRLETPVRTSEGGETAWFEQNLPPGDGGFWRIDEDISSGQEIVRALRHLATLPTRGPRDLHKLFLMATEQFRTHGAVDRRQIAREFGVSDTAISHMWRDLRRELTSIGFLGT